MRDQSPGKLYLVVSPTFLQIARDWYAGVPNVEVLEERPIPMTGRPMKPKPKPKPGKPKPRPGC